MKLWEADHPYYCNLGNYYSNDCGARYKTWSEFIASEGDADLDMNLVFRWDWINMDESDNWPSDERPYSTGDELHIFTVQQRKGVVAEITIVVERSEEPQVIAWLQPRWEHLQRLWQPLPL